MSEQQPATDPTSGPTTESSESEDDSRDELPESEPGEIGDDKLPEDLQPTEDNPLARHPGQTGDEDDRIGADVEGSDPDNPSANMTYGSGPDDGGSDDDSSDDDSSEEN
ncbi:MAG: hypothetical protein JWR85_1616 [Marmoricola sp.]|nr:hypothetical protein [Marmoricola sp.]